MSNCDKLLPVTFFPVAPDNEMSHLLCLDWMCLSPTQGYWGCRVFIVAQTPLADTTGDFWSMIYQKKVYTVVMLSDSSEGDAVHTI